ncbi:MAG TPA: TIGR00725 family protein [Candidatus Omnitrophota bacterium]|nr:TIGR00725 family protein [Candidatus Omnitrophota bacterium]HPB68597.1 TIGR00725 family protein [Candidatus Omnitrophota bacterium]HQO57718.1 TIGR00725 family protein [Candidatus Omnitrophota bacterium]HQP11968.1 TIGR00725 family protein [Candidatus Omnitrophota bacterium]
MRYQKITVSVLGSHSFDGVVEEFVYNVGKIIGKMGCVLVCGGLGGVMEIVSRGAKDAGGLTIGLLPGTDKNDANTYIDIALPTSIGFARNAMVACSADIIVALPGSYGTESEICYGLVYKRPVLDLGNWNIPGMIPVQGLADFEQRLQQLVKTAFDEA